ncbi:hypothetical protein BHM03_00025698 [Ensete ventricosum]|nr:hypothetical protein BHM03_00025698 [Ensete ventricosum]
MKGVDIKDKTWSRGTKLSLDRDQGHKHLQRQEGDHIVPWVLHSDGADSSCMVPKMKRASRHMHLISEMHLMGELRCEAIDSRAMGLTVPWYRRGGTSMEASIPCSYGGRVLVTKGAEEVENAEANSKYQDRVEGQMLRNLIRLVSTGRGALYNLCNMRPLATLAYNMEGLFPLLERSIEIDKDQHSLANSTPELIISELKQYAGSEFNISTTVAKSNWEPREAPCARATVCRSRQQGAAPVEVLPTGMAPTRRGDRPRLAVLAVGAAAHSIIVG